jgi:hypothetical protein
MNLINSRYMRIAAVTVTARRPDPSSLDRVAAAASSGSSGLCSSPE